MKFRVRGFAGPRHQGGAPFGSLLMETTHRTMGSAQIEVMAWQARMKRGEVSRVELIDQRPGGGMTNLDVQEHTQLDWK